MSRPIPSLSVLLATRNRSASLDRTLQSISLAIRQLETVQVVVVDDGSTDDTPSVLYRWRSNIRLDTLQTHGNGKSAALNLGIACARAPLIQFTDDDVDFDPQHFDALIRASQTHNDASIFCGPINPLFPPNTPSWVADPDFVFAGPTFARYTPRTTDGLADQWPFGPNFAVRASLLGATAFDEAIGPRNGITYMGEETDLLRRLTNDGNRIRFVTQAAVQHRIRPEQVRMSWLTRRMWHVGHAIGRRQAVRSSVVVRQLSYARQTLRAKQLLRKIRQFPVGNRPPLLRLKLARILGKAEAFRRSLRDGNA